MAVALGAGAAAPASVTTFAPGTVRIDRVLRDGHKIAPTTVVRLLRD